MQQNQREQLIQTLKQENIKQISKMKQTDFQKQFPEELVKSNYIETNDQYFTSSKTRETIKNSINPNAQINEPTIAQNNRYWKVETKKNNFSNYNQKHDCSICDNLKQKHTKFKEKQKRQNFDLNKILLQSRLLVEKNKLEEAYNLMNPFLEEGIFCHSDLFFLQGDVLRQLGRYQESEHYLLEALKFEVYSPQCLVSLAQCYMSMSLYGRASILFKKAIDFTDTAEINHMLALCLIHSKQYLEAAVNLTRAIDLNEDNAIYYLNRGSVYEKLGFQELARNDYLRYKDLNPFWREALEQYIIEAEEENNYSEKQSLIKLLQQIDCL